MHGTTAIQIPESGPRNPTQVNSGLILGARKVCGGHRNPLSPDLIGTDEDAVESLRPATPRAETPPRGGTPLPGSTVTEPVPAPEPEPPRRLFLGAILGKPPLEDDEEITKILWNYFGGRRFFWNRIGARLTGIVAKEAESLRVRRDNDAQANAVEVAKNTVPAAATKGIATGTFFANRGKSANPKLAPLRGGEFHEIVPGEARDSALKVCQDVLTPMLGSVLGYELPKFLMFDLGFQVPGIKQVAAIGRIAWEAGNAIRTKFWHLPDVKQAQEVFRDVKPAKIVADGLRKILEKSLNKRLFNLGSLALDFVVSMVDISGIASLLVGITSSAARLIMTLTQIWCVGQMMAYVNEVLDQDELKPRLFNLELFRQFPLLACYITDVTAIEEYRFIGCSWDEYYGPHGPDIDERIKLWHRTKEIAEIAKADESAVLAQLNSQGQWRIPYYVTQTLDATIIRGAVSLPSKIKKAPRTIAVGAISAARTVKSGPGRLVKWIGHEFRSSQVQPA